MYGAFSVAFSKKWMWNVFEPEMYLNSIVATRLHDQAATSKESTDGEILFFCWVAILWSAAPTLDIILI